MRAPFLLLALAALLAWSTYQAHSLSVETTPIVRAERRPASTQLTTAPTFIPPAPYAPPAAPPLFRAATAPVAAQPGPGESFALIGLAGRTEARIAYVRDTADGRVFTLRIGESARDWVLENADERCVVLRHARRRQNVCLS